MLVKGKFAFYHIPRTGGSSIEQLLWFDSRLDSPSWKRMGPVHAPLKDQPIVLEDYDIYTNIRNPYSRLVSLYSLVKFGGVHDIDVDEDLGFDEFIYEHWGAKLGGHDEYNTQEEHLFVRGKLPENVSLVKMEKMNWKWQKLMKELFGVKNMKVPHINSMSHKHHMFYYDRDLINYVSRKEDWVLQFYR